MKESAQKFIIFIFFVVVIAVVAFFVTTTIYADKYLEIRDVIIKCNSDYGGGNWILTYYDNTSSYGCRTYAAVEFKTCYIDDTQVNCER